MSCEQIFRKQLRQRGFRLTPQRELVLEALHQLGRAASVDEVFSRVAARSSNVELSTVYRTLDLLSSMGLVAVIDVGDRQRRFVLRHENVPHLHLVCRGCGQIFGVELELFAPLLEHIRSALHFQTDLSSITLPGTCASCAGLAAG